MNRHHKPGTVIRAVVITLLLIGGQNALADKNPGDAGTLGVDGSGLATVIVVDLGAVSSGNGKDEGVLRPMWMDVLCSLHLPLTGCSNSH